MSSTFRIDKIKFDLTYNIFPLTIVAKMSGPLLGIFCKVAQSLQKFRPPWLTEE